MKYEPINSNFIPPTIHPEDYVFGNQLKGKVLRENGDWRDYLPKAEDQYKNGIETSACATYHTLDPIEILQEEQFDIKDGNYSERFISMLSGTTKQGNSPNTVAQTIRDKGLIPESMLPFDDSIENWEQFNSYSGSDERLCLIAGKQWLKKWDFHYDWVFTGGTVEEKYAKMREALKYSPLGVSVYAWTSENDIYVKPKNVTDNHWTNLIYIDEQNRPYIFDSYSPYIKILEPFYDFGFSMRYSIEKKSVDNESANPNLFAIIKNLWTLLLAYFKR